MEWVYFEIYFKYKLHLVFRTSFFYVIREKCLILCDFLNFALLKNLRTNIRFIYFTIWYFLRIYQKFCDTDVQREKLLLTQLVTRIYVCTYAQRYMSLIHINANDIKLIVPLIMERREMGNCIMVYRCWCRPRALI